MTKTEPDNENSRCLTDDQAEELGKAIANILWLRRDKEYGGELWNTSWGRKTNLGLGRTVETIYKQLGEEK